MDKDRWDLYNTRQDFSLANDLAAKNPQKLKEIQALFMKEALKYGVLPIGDRSIERFNPRLAGRNPPAHGSIRRAKVAGFLEGLKPARHDQARGSIASRNGNRWKSVSRV